MGKNEKMEVLYQYLSGSTNGEADILVSTMIVESGLDVPNANTMFVNRADHLGMELYGPFVGVDGAAKGRRRGARRGMSDGPQK